MDKAKSDAHKKAAAVNLNQCNFVMRMEADKDVTCAILSVPDFLKGNYIGDSLDVLGCSRKSLKDSQQFAPGTPVCIEDEHNFYINGHALELLAKAGIEKLAPFKPRASAIGKLAG